MTNRDKTQRAITNIKHALRHIIDRETTDDEAQQITRIANELTSLAAILAVKHNLPR